ncbi:hypothetical protein AJ78_05004 [Emergomyces pasteurianus Ep9510]|uniref:Uncharacterized protein n=1 Tax=Emergomyces pasteurianus Ep9510 TaxID=1447872 RepID=A0A1J9PDK3_9EURO|nr:hypothetical protein AJ78_05004 [Emergomyces pasteurianus Ep9510]
MSQAMKLNDRTPDNTPPAQTPPGDGYQHPDAKQLVEAPRRVRANSTTIKLNPSKDTAETVLNTNYYATSQYNHYYWQVSPLMNPFGELHKHVLRFVKFQVCHVFQT